MFRLEYRPAFYAWLAMHPFTNLRSPPGPIFMPQYRNALVTRGAAQDKKASQEFARGASAQLRVALLCVALVLLGIALGSIATYPRL